MKRIVLVLSLLLFAFSVAAADNEVRLIYSCDSRNYNEKNQSERFAALLEFVRREKNLLHNSGSVFFVLFFQEAKDLESFSSPKMTLAKSMGVLTGILTNESRENKSPDPGEIGPGKTLVLSSGYQQFYFGKAEKISDYAMVFDFASAPPATGQGQIYFLHDAKLPFFGFQNGYGYLNCMIPYGNVGRLRLFYRNRQLIRQSHDVVQINLDETSNSWIVP